MTDERDIDETGTGIDQGDRPEEPELDPIEEPEGEE